MTRNSKTHTRARALTHAHTHAHTHEHNRAAGINEIAEPDASAAVYPALFCNRIKRQRTIPEKIFKIFGHGQNCQNWILKWPYQLHKS